MKICLFFSLFLISWFSHSHEGEHAAPAKVVSGTYIHYSEALGRRTFVQFIFDEPNFIQLGEKSRTFKCDEEGYICTDKRSYCDNDDVIIAFDGGFRFVPGCGEKQEYFTIMSE